MKDFIKEIPKNLFAGFVVSLVALPLGLGLAIASEAMARPNPRGNATNDTTNPANKFLGTSFIKSFIIYYFQFFIMRTSVGNSDKICSMSLGKILETKEERFVSEFRTSKSARTTLA